MAKPIARKPDAHKSESTSLSFKKDPETGYYRKIEQKLRYHHLDHVTKKIGKPVVHEDFYEISTQDDFDHKFSVTGPDGKPFVLYLKKLEEIE